MVSGSISLPSQGYFSPFPHGTGSLSVANEYLALRGGPRRFTRRFTCAVLLRNSLGPHQISVTRMSRSLSTLSKVFTYRQSPTSGSYNPDVKAPVWAGPLSLATTYGIEFSFFSSAY